MYLLGRPTESGVAEMSHPSVLVFIVLIVTVVGDNPIPKTWMTARPKSADSALV